MSSDIAADTLNKEESEIAEQSNEEKIIETVPSESEGENEEEDDDEEEEEDEDEKKEKSLIVEGKREKKKVERLSLEMTLIKKEQVLTEGKGQKLYDIERIQYFIKKKKCEELRLLHRLLFNRVGTVNLVKKNIGQFNGFPFEEGTEQYKKKEDMLKKFKKSDLKNICGVLDLEKSGVNSELISKIMTFLMEPKSTGKCIFSSKLLYVQEKAVQSESESDNSSDDEPLIKKLKKPPTDDELRETVKKLLADANLEEVTMKQICKKVYESYPSYDLSARKEFIKATVKELIS
ncbi:protein DEK [Bombina bombina]|uniref:protein DEK n=1 Tax=Bombina bombina TaxID=8345 RepID=UPI00235AAE10|nr:protein DEK [Bombina bombina]